MLRLLASAATGLGLGRADAALDGRGALVASEQRVGLSPDEADRLAYDLHVQSRVPPTLFPDRWGNPTDPVDRSTLSFLRFLQWSYDDAALGRLARGAPTEDVETAAQWACGRLLVALQHAWLAGLRTRFEGSAGGREPARPAPVRLHPYQLRAMGELSTVAPERLAQIPLLASLNPAELAVVAIWVRVERYPPGR